MSTSSWRRVTVSAAALLVLGACGGTPQDPTAQADSDGADVAAPATEAPGSGAPATEAAGSEAPEGDAGGDPIQVGISLPLTGDFSEPGTGVREGYEVWAEMVNGEGGLLGRQVELIFRDDGSEPNQAVSDYESLITQDEVDLVFGPFSSRLVIPSAQVAQEYDMLFVQPAGAAPEVFEQGFDNLFYAAPAIASDHYDYLAEWILDQPEGERPQTVAVASLDDPFAQGTAYGLRDQLEEGGLEIVADEVYPPNQTDFSSTAARIASADADLVIGGTQFEDSVGLVRSFQELGYQPDMAAFSTGPTLPEFPEAVGGAVEGILSPVGWSARADTTGNEEFVAAYEERFGAEPSEDAANGYTVGQVVAQAAEEVDCADASAECQSSLIDYIRSNEFDTIVGPLSFDDAGRPEAAHLIQQYVDGQVEIVLPAGEDVQTAEIVYPKPEW